jgi:uncharacterized Fe-S cluster-containing protein
MVKVHILEDGREAVLHVLADTHFLLVDGLDLHELVLVLEAEQERVVDEVKVETLRKISTECLHWIESRCQKARVKLTDRQSILILVALVQ